MATRTQSPRRQRRQHCARCKDYKEQRVLGFRWRLNCGGVTRHAVRSAGEGKHGGFCLVNSLPWCRMGIARHFPTHFGGLPISVSAKQGALCRSHETLYRRRAQRARRQYQAGRGGLALGPFSHLRLGGASAIRLETIASRLEATRSKGHR